MMRIGVLVAGLALAAAGCASRVSESDVRYGRVVRIDPVSLQGEHQLGAGHALGAVAGGALGYQFGNGSGRMVAQALGALGGGYAGGMPQNEYPGARPGEHVTVTLASGVAIGVTQLAPRGLRVGDCVRISGSGQTARVARTDCVGTQAEAGAAGPGATPQADAFRDELRERVRERMAREAPPVAVTTRPASAPPGESAVRSGRIVRIDALTLRSDHEMGLEGVMNGVSGAALGDPLPGGDGRAFADVANTLGSAPAGTANIIYASPQPGQLITVKLDNGVAVSIVQLADEALRAGDRVRIDGAGPTARVTRA